MKKNILVALLPLVMLTSCSTSSYGMGHKSNAPCYVGNEPIPTVRASANATHVTYLMMSRYGYLNVENEQGELVKVKGTTYEEKFLEYAIKYESEPNAALPAIKDVGSDVDGATFRGWAQYNDNVYPDYLSKVPSVSGQCVYAIFDGTNPGGSSGGGSTTPTDTFKEGTAYVVGNRDYSSGTSAIGESWNDVTKAYAITTVNTNATSGAKVEVFGYVTFSVGDIWKIRTGPSDSSYLQDSHYEKGGAIESGFMSLESDGFGGTNVVVAKAGTYVIYYKVYEDGWNSMYVNLAE